MAVNLPLNADDPTKLLPLSDKGTKVYNYHYDQLNRLVAMDAFGGLNTATHTFSPVLLNDYQERVTYDPNGNILTYNRNGNQSANEAMDRLVYTYGTTNNQLNTLVDNASDGTYTTDIKAPAASPINYSYNQIGNITQDGSNAISWTVYGKIASQTGSGGTISYLYDAAANRISKTTSTGTTLYVRDPQGNVLATYQRGTSGAFAQLEIELYGSSRLGMTRAPALPSQTINLSGGGTASVASFTRGLKSYELANHLGNVLATITDKKIGVSSDGSLTISSYNADIATVQDYYPFGMQMPGRTFTAGGAGNYRYGFNGKENDNEVKGTGDQIDYGMRVYDPRVAKFMSVDPLTKKYPELTPYQFASNRPIDGSDLDGEEWELRTVNDRLRDIRRTIDAERVRQAGTIRNWDGHKLSYWGKVHEQVQKVKYLAPTISLAYGILDDAYVTYTGWKYGPGYARHLDYSSVDSYKERITAGINTVNLLFGGIQSLGEYGLIRGLSQVERQILKVSSDVVKSKEFDVIREAYRNGVEAEVNIKGVPVMYKPDWTYSEAMSLQQEGGFILGPKAFTAKGGVEQTVLWEMSRLKLQNGNELGVGETRQSTDEAQQTSERLLPYFNKKR